MGPRVTGSLHPELAPAEARRPPRTEPTRSVKKILGTAEGYHPSGSCWEVTSFLLRKYSVQLASGVRGQRK